MNRVMYEVIKSNIPIEKILLFREVGYIESVLDALIKELDISEFEPWLIFRLSSHREQISIPVSKRKQIVFIIADESDFIPEIILKTSHAIFRQYLPDNLDYNHVFHLPVGPSRVSQCRPYKPVENRRYNVFFSGNLHLGRRELYNNFTRMRLLPFSMQHRIQGVRKAVYDTHYPQSYIRFSKGFHTGLDPNDYAEILYNSKITLCPYGLSSKETMRHFEAMRAGTLVVTKPMPAHHCYQKAPFITIEHWKNLDEQIEFLLSSRTLLRERQEQTLSWWNEVCSPKAVASYIIDRLSTICPD